MKQFSLKLIILSVVAVVAYQLIDFLKSSFFFEYHPFIAVFFFIITLAFHNGLNKSLEKGNQQFIRYYMGATGLKLMIIMLFVIIVALTNKSIAMNFTLCTFFYYIFFSSFEVWVAMKQFGHKKNVS